jgi:nucleoid-associated protein EbfC
MPQPPNLQKMLQQAQEMMAAQQEAQEALKKERVSASAGGGMVKVVVSGDMRLQELTIDPDAVDPDDVEMLQDLVLAAVNQAMSQAEELAAQKLQGGGMADFDPMSALDSLGLGGALGGGGGLPGGSGGVPGGAGNRAARRAQKKR